MKGRCSTTWFDKLRRDRSLFVLLASLVLLLQAMQPLAHASQQTNGGAFVICTDGDVDPLRPQLHVDCLTCIASACRAMPVAIPDMAAGPVIFTVRGDEAIKWPAAAHLPGQSPVATSLPPARGPPALA